jgi:hypothetical protein
MQKLLKIEGHLLFFSWHVAMTFCATSKRIVAVLNDGCVRQVNGIRIKVGIFILC